MTLLELQAKYPKTKGLKYEPREKCRFCGGTGETRKGHLVRPCICVFVQHDFVDQAAAGLARAAKSLLAERHLA